MKEFGKKFPLLFGVIAFCVLYGGIKLIPAEGNLQQGLLRYALSAVMILVTWPAAQGVWLRFPGSGWKAAFKRCEKLLVFTAVFALVVTVLPVLSLGILKLTGQADAEAQSMQFNANWAVDMIWFLFNMISVGIVEEVGLRRSVFYLGMKQCPHMKNKVFWWAVISSAIFGFIHVASDLSMNPSAIASGLTKTVQTGLLGFIMCAAVMESQNIWTVALIHAINDVLPSFITVIMNVQMKDSYVTNNATVGEWFGDNWATLLFVLIYLPIAIGAGKKLKEYDRDGWSCP